MNEDKKVYLCFSIHVDILFYSGKLTAILCKTGKIVKENPYKAKAGYKKHLKVVTFPILINPVHKSNVNPIINKNQESFDKNWKYVLYFFINKSRSDVIINTITVIDTINIINPRNESLVSNDILYIFVISSILFNVSEIVLFS